MTVSSKDNNNGQRAVEADWLVGGGGGGRCPEADRLREIGMMMFRHYYVVAQMTEAGYGRDPERVLDSLRKGRELYLSFLYGAEPDKTLMAEFADVEARTLATIEWQARNRRVS
jgi:hypothetical protein